MTIAAILTEVLDLQTEAAGLCCTQRQVGYGQAPAAQRQHLQQRIAVAQRLNEHARAQIFMFLASHPLAAPANT